MGQRARFLRPTGVYLSLAVLISLLVTPIPSTRDHEKQVQVSGDYEITYFSSPTDPITNSPTMLFLQARSVSSGEKLRVLHFLVQMIPPSGPRIIQHPLSNSTIFTFNQPGNWILLVEVGMKSIASFEATATFAVDVAQAGRGSPILGFLDPIVVTVPNTVARWGYILAAAPWLGLMPYIASLFRLLPHTTGNFSLFAMAEKNADFVVVSAIGRLGTRW